MAETFDMEFQKFFLNHLLRDSQFCLSVISDVDYDIFSDQTAQRVVRIVKDFAAENHAAPSTLIFNYLDDLKKKNLLGSELHSVINTFVDELYALPLQNGAYLLSKFNEFSRQQKIKVALPNFMEFVKKGDYKSAEELMAEIFTFRQSKKLDLGSNFDLDPSLRIQRRFHEDTTRFWTLIPEIDSRIDGLKPGELGVWQSQRSSSGKTAALVLLARSFLFQGKKVLVYVLEGSDDAWLDRLDQCICGVTRKSLTDYTKLAIKLQKLAHTGGNLWIKSFPMYLTKVSDLRKNKDQLENVHGFHPDVILVDYADLLAPETNSIRGDLHATGAEVYGSLIGWMQEDHLGGWTAAQSGRGAMEEIKADQVHISGSIAKVQLAQLILSINSTDAEVREKKTRIYVVKDRDGPARYSFNIKTDFERQQFWIRKSDDEEKFK